KSRTPAPRPSMIAARDLFAPCLMLPQALLLKELRCRLKSALRPVRQPPSPLVAPAPFYLASQALRSNVRVVGGNLKDCQGCLLLHQKHFGLLGRQKVEIAHRQN